MPGLAAWHREGLSGHPSVSARRLPEASLVFCTAAQVSKECSDSQEVEAPALLRPWLGNTTSATSSWSEQSQNPPRSTGRGHKPNLLMAIRTLPPACSQHPTTPRSQG